MEDSVAKKIFVGVAIVVIGALILGAIKGLGSGSSTSTTTSTASSKVASTVMTFLSTTAKGDGPAAYALLTPSGMQLVIHSKAAAGAPSCSAAIENGSKKICQGGKQALLSADVTDISVIGDSARAGVKGATGSIALAATGGRWLIAASNLAFPNTC